MNVTRAIIVPLGILGIAVTLAACGSSSDAGVTSADAPAVTSSQAPDPSATSNGAPAAPVPQGTADREELRSCLAAKGITLPNRTGDGAPPTGAPNGAPPAGQGAGPGLPDGIDQQAFQDAMQACGANFSGGFPGGAGAAGGPGSTAFEAYRSCLDDHGVSLPNTAGSRPNLDQSDPEVSAAMKTCAPLMPSRQTAPAAN
ncbi:MAG: hypothetical protein Q8M73_09605 [Actinomycetota bacterium]|nr:hypothetical protein [Actinomycetota bacterium]